MERFKPSIDNGLNDEQVQQRIAEGNYNKEITKKTKSIPRIIRDNVCTLFNLLNLILAALVIMVGYYRNLLFMLVVLLNILISTVQEIASKKAIDKLTILSQSKNIVIRNGKKVEIPINQIVLDDIIQYSQGNQITVDSRIEKGEVEVNESFITGETEPVYKKKGDMLISGSFVVSGSAIAQVEHIGKDNYTNQIYAGTKNIKQPNSEIMKTLKGIIQTLSIAIIPIGLLLFRRQISIDGNTLQMSVVNTVAAILGMIPEGLMLLTSSVLALASIKLAKKKVLVQQLYCVETLARVDTICFDKTGTLTVGKMKVNDILPINNKKKSKKDIENILENMMAAFDDHNSTAEAIEEYLKTRKSKNEKSEPKAESDELNTRWKVIGKKEFSSKTKFSMVRFEQGEYKLGAAEMILTYEQLRAIPVKINTASKETNVAENETSTTREAVKAAGKVKSKSFKEIIANENKVEKLDDEILLEEALKQYSKKYRTIVLTEDGEPIAIILISDVIRKEASQTIDYFKKQNVDIKIISGDNPVTVSNIAKECSVENWQNYIDMSKISDDIDEKDFEKLVEQNVVFGRTSPMQKKEIVKVLKKQGHTVAMTGDGVNDVLAMKESDCAVAMANGADATKNIAEIVLVDSNFKSMPKVVEEGRQAINNVQRSAALFLTKTIFSTMLAVFFVFMNRNYPFMPIQMTLVNALCIGAPSFLLALEPNREKIKGGFLKNILVKAMPTGLTVVAGVVLTTIYAQMLKVSTLEYTTLCLTIVAVAGSCLLLQLAYKTKYEREVETEYLQRKAIKRKFIFSPYRLLIAVVMIVALYIGFKYGRKLFVLSDVAALWKQELTIIILTVGIFAITNFVVKILGNKVYCKIKKV